MQSELQCVKFKIRPVKESDAARIVKLRRAPANSKYINETSESIDAQVDYIRYVSRKTDDYFFAVESIESAEFFGTVAIYDIREEKGVKVGEWGRFILWPHLSVAVETCAMIYRFAFEQLSMDKVYCRTVSANKPVVSLHDTAGLRRTAVLPAHFNGIDSIEHELTSDEFPKIAQNLNNYISKANAINL